MPSVPWICQKSNLWRHCKYRCVARKMGGASNVKGYLEIQSELLQNPNCFHGASEKPKKVVLPFMKNDDITQVCKCDPILIELGNQWLKKVGEERKNLASSKMRSGAALLLELRKLGQGTSLSDFLTAGHFDNVTAAVEKRAGSLDLEDEGDRPDTNMHPFTAVRLGHNLVRLASIKKCFAISSDATRAAQAAHRCPTRRKFRIEPRILAFIWPLKIIQTIKKKCVITIV